MSGRIPDEVLQAIRERVGIVEVVSGYVSLKRAGRNHIGLCPFHGEKTPSFTVNEERGLFHCFGCGLGGSVFSFVMQADHVTFREAVETLARRAGIELPRTPLDQAAEHNRNRLLEVNTLAQECFQNCLRSDRGRPAREYLRQRGFEQAIIERYGVGFCPPGGVIYQALRSRRSELGKAVEVGLVGTRSDGSGYDRFRGRVMFPIHDSSGRIVGFGGRTLGMEPPKYLNSPESVLFRKGSVLYGLYEARESIRAAGRIVLVEGYLDALALVAHGIGCAVATLGTALGVNQLRAARRFAPEIIAFFDGDRAGRVAASRAFTSCVQADVWGLAAFLPDGFDPDTFVQEKGVDATQELLNQATPLADFFLETSLPGANATVPQRTAAAKVVGEVLKQIKDAAQFGLLARTAAQRLGVDEALFREMRLQEGSPAARATASGQSPPPIASNEESIRPEEAGLIEAVVLDATAARVASESGIIESLDDQKLASAAKQAIEAWRTGGEASTVLNLLPQSLASRISAGLVGHGVIPTGGFEAVARDCIARIRSRQQRSKANSLRMQLSRAEASGDDANSLAKLHRINDLIRYRPSSG